VTVHTYMPSELMCSGHVFTTSQMNTTPALQNVAFFVGMSKEKVKFWKLRWRLEWVMLPTPKWKDVYCFQPCYQ